MKIFNHSAAQQLGALFWSPGIVRIAGETFAQVTFGARGHDVAVFVVRYRGSGRSLGIHVKFIGDGGSINVVRRR